jgi:hypothetical protein
MHAYWNKLALVVAQNSVQEAMEIFDRAISPGVLSCSVEMWQCYCDFAVHHNIDIGDDEIRNIFERCLEVVGSDYPADSLWAMYIRWEEEKSRWDEVSSLFCRVLSQPVRNLSSFWSSFVDHATNHTIERAATPSEKIQIENQLNIEADNDVTLTTDALAAKMQQMIFLCRKSSFDQTLAEISKTLLFEMKTKRSYFHFKLPVPTQTANWMEYLTYSESCGDINKTIHLFERSLIPLNLYPGIWARYAMFVLQKQGAAEAHEIWKRASLSPLKEDPELMRLRGLFEESIQNYDDSDKLHQSLENQKSAAAALVVAFHILRECGHRTGTVDVAVERFQVILLEFLAVTIKTVGFCVSIFRFIQNREEMRCRCAEGVGYGCSFGSGACGSSFDRAR